MECGSEQRKEMIVDLVMMTTLGECEPDKDPLIVLPCGHAYTVSTLDSHMEMDKVYRAGRSVGDRGGQESGSRSSSGRAEAEGGVEGSPSTARGISAAGAAALARAMASTSTLPTDQNSDEDDSSAAVQWTSVRAFESHDLWAVKGCPDCRAPITSIWRYGRAVKKAMMDQSERKFAEMCLKDLDGLSGRYRHVLQELAGIKEGERWVEKKSASLLQKLEELGWQLNREERRCSYPPTVNVYNAALAAVKRREMDEDDGQSSVSATPAARDFASGTDRCVALYVPRPDVRPLCEALLLHGDTWQLVMRCSALQLQQLGSRWSKIMQPRGSQRGRRVLRGGGLIGWKRGEGISEKDQ